MTRIGSTWSSKIALERSIERNRTGEHAAHSMRAEFKDGYGGLLEGIGPSEQDFTLCGLFSRLVGR